MKLPLAFIKFNSSALALAPPEWNVSVDTFLTKVYSDGKSFIWHTFPTHHRLGVDKNGKLEIDHEVHKVASFLYTFRKFVCLVDRCRKLPRLEYLMRVPVSNRIMLGALVATMIISLCR